MEEQEDAIIITSCRISWPLRTHVARSVADPPVADYRRGRLRPAGVRQEAGPRASLPGGPRPDGVSLFRVDRDDDAGHRARDRRGPMVGCEARMVIFRVSDGRCNLAMPMTSSVRRTSG